MTNKKISALTLATTPLAGTELVPLVQSSATVSVTIANLTAGRSVNVSSLQSSGVITSGQGGTGVTNADLTLSGSSATNYGPLIRFNKNGSSKGFLGTKSVVDGGTSDAIKLYTTNGFEVQGTITTTDNIIPSTAATGINFTANTPAAGKTSQLLNWYEEGNWTPTDNSGAGLTFDIRYAKYTRVGRAVHIVVYMVWPVTASAASAALAGLPFTNVTNGFASLSVSSGSGTALGGQVNSGATTINLFPASNYNLGITNASLSAGGVEIAGTYFIS